MPARPIQRLFAAILTAGVLMAPAAMAQDAKTLTEIVEAWLASPHADRASESFTHWDEDGSVPENCATCHSGPGFLDFVGADGSAAGVVDHPAPIGSPVDCATCHSAASAALDTVTFPSGEVVADLGSSAVCMVCHQGRESGDRVSAVTEGADDDTVKADLGFLNIHYRAAAATLLGSTVRGGFQYPGKEYAGRFGHVPPLNTCTGCHDPHETKVAVTQCVACHAGVTSADAIRTNPNDSDGDGDTTEGVAFEIASLHDRLDAAIRLYASEIAGTAMVYHPAAYPYFFNDTDGDGTASDAEASFPNRYQSWTPRLLRAAYNYQFVAKDTGAFAHNPHYAIQLIVDSLENLGEKVTVDTAGLIRP